MRAILLTLLSLLLLGSTSCRSGDDGAQAASEYPRPDLHRQPEKERAPDFTLKTLDGDEVRLRDALARGPVVLDFWATWCAPCKVAMPFYDELVARYAEHGVQLLSVNQDDPRMHDRIAPYFESKGFTFPALLDPDKRVSQAYGVMNLPTSFLLSPDGRIAARHVGFRLGDEKVLERQLREVLGLDPGR